MDRFAEVHKFECPIEGNQPVPAPADAPRPSIQAHELADIQIRWDALQEAEAEACFVTGHLLNDLLGSPDEPLGDQGREILKLLVKRMGIPRKLLNKFRRRAWDFPMPKDDWG